MTARTTFQIALQPVSGPGGKFQPTGFPDLGAAIYQRPIGDSDWQDALHVESPQSMANRLEATTWDLAADNQPAALDGLPYVRVETSDGNFLTSSRIEPHRLAGAYVSDAVVGSQTFLARAKDEMGIVKGEGLLPTRVIAQTLMRYDPMSLVHGVFFSRMKDRQPKMPRALTCFIEAYDVRPVSSGGVKTDPVRPALDAAGGGTAEGYGMVPHQRLEFTAREITAHVSIDHAQIRSYGLGDAGSELLEALIGYEFAHLFRGEEGLRLRTACDLEVADDSNSGFDNVPAVDDADERVRAAIGGASALLGDVLTVTWKKASGGGS
jgi:CRISPR-associated protein Csb1